MSILRPFPKLEEKLRVIDYNLEKYCPSVDEFEEMKSCDVLWYPTKFSQFIHSIPLIPESLKSYFICYRGKLKTDPCEIYSITNPNLLLIIKDDLKLSRNELWVNDQVYTKDGIRLIGNSKGIHYKFKRVSK